MEKQSLLDRCYEVYEKDCERVKLFDDKTGMAAVLRFLAEEILENCPNCDSRGVANFLLEHADESWE